MNKPEIMKFLPSQQFQARFNPQFLQFDFDLFGIVYCFIGNCIELTIIKNMKCSIWCLFLTMNFYWYIFEVVCLYFQKVYLIDKLCCQFVDIKCVGLIVLEFF